MSAQFEHPPVKTKLIATIGPACREPKILAELLNAGLDICRFNFSHGTLEEHGRVLDTIRALSAQRRQPITIIGDLCGPKIRLNRFANDEAVELCAGQTIRIARGDHECNAGEFTTSYTPFVDEVPVGHRVLIDDGLIRLLVTEQRTDVLLCSCTVGGRVSSRKGINLPDTRLSVPALSDKDLRDLDWAIENDLDYIALSFVRTPADLDQLRQAIARRNGDLRVIVKIEKTEALEHLDELVAGCDGLLVARGDLGVEMDVWQVPLVQKALTRRCRMAGVPVIIATQMLQSMVEHPMPTRAEVSDVANAILDAADAVMLSAETAVGRHPAHAVDIMNKVAAVTEAYLAIAPPLTPPPPQPAAALNSPEAISHAAAEAAVKLKARLVAVWTATGNTVRLVARHRLSVPVVGLTWDPRVARRINLLYGVIPIHIEPTPEPEPMFRVLDARLTELGLAQRGDLIVIVTSTRPNLPGGTNAMFVHVVGDDVAEPNDSSSE